MHHLPKHLCYKYSHAALLRQRLQAIPALEHVRYEGGLIARQAGYAHQQAGYAHQQAGYAHQQAGYAHQQACSFVKLSSHTDADLQTCTQADTLG